MPGLLFLVVHPSLLGPVDGVRATRLLRHRHKLVVGTSPMPSVVSVTAIGWLSVSRSTLQSSVRDGYNSFVTHNLYATVVIRLSSLSITCPFGNLICSSLYTSSLNRQLPPSARHRHIIRSHFSARHPCKGNVQGRITVSLFLKLCVTS